MMDFISVPVTFGVGAYAFYKVIELFVRKRERLLLIDKLNSLENVNTTNINLSEILERVSCSKVFNPQELDLY